MKINKFFKLNTSKVRLKTNLLFDLQTKLLVLIFSCQYRASQNDLESEWIRVRFWHQPGTKEIAEHGADRQHQRDPGQEERR